MGRATIRRFIIGVAALSVYGTGRVQAQVTTVTFDNTVTQPPGADPED